MGLIIHRRHLDLNTRNLADEKMRMNGDRRNRQEITKVISINALTSAVRVKDNDGLTLRIKIDKARMMRGQDALKL